MSSDNLITKENMDTYLKAIAKQYRKLVKKAMPAEITLVGGASILINFLNMSASPKMVYPHA